MTTIEAQANVGSIVRLVLQLGLGAWLAKHGVADMEAFASLAVIVLTAVWSMIANKRKLAVEPPKPETKETT